jgi:hypothetical protein
MKKLFFLLVAIILFSACAPSPEAIQNTLTQNQAALPTLSPTPSPIPLSEINLDNILFLPGDLPKGFIFKSIIEETSSNERVPGQVKRIVLELTKQDTGNGVVSISLFEDTEKRDQEFSQSIELYSDTLEAKSEDLIDLEDIGEYGKLFRNDTPLGTGLSISFLFFVRCHASVSMDIVSDNETDSIIQSYAKKLDERLTNVICR